MPQELQACASMRTDKDKHGLTASGKMQMREKVRSFLKKLDPAAPAAKKPRALREPGLPNIHQLRALDHALWETWEIDLTKFKVKRAVRALEDTEERFFKPVAELPPKLQRISGPRIRRSCVKDNATGKTRLEVAWGEPRMLLHECIDMGSKGWPLRTRMYSSMLGLRGTYQNDPHHRRHDGGLNSMTASGLRLLRLEYGFAMNFVSGPWDSDAFGCTLEEALEEWYATESYDNELFELLYPRIVRDLTENRPPGHYGSREHQQQVWNEIPSLVKNLRAGSNFKLNRWWAFGAKVLKSRPFSQLGHGRLPLCQHCQGLCGRPG